MTTALVHKVPADALAGERHRKAFFWLQGLLVLQLCCQLALLVPLLGPLRLVWRSATFGASLALLFLLKGRGRPHPCRRLALVILGLVALGLFHPEANTPTAGVAQWLMYLAILGPLFWTSRLAVTPAVLRRLLLLLWAFQTASAAVGVLQVLYPGQFEPNLSSNYTGLGQDYVDSLKVTLASGEKIMRPMGLTDTPGGAASGGMTAVVFGLGLYLIDRRPVVRTLAILGLGIGLFCLYLCQVRSVLVMTGVCVAVLVGVLLWRREWTRAVSV